MCIFLELGMLPRLDYAFHAKFFDLFLIDLKFNYISKPEYGHPAILHYTNKILDENVEEHGKPYEVVRFNQSPILNYNSQHILKECYLGHAFKYQAETLLLPSVNFLTLYQYMP